MIRHGKDAAAPELQPGPEAGDHEVARKRTLGNVRLRHHQTHEIIKVPTPSADPNDPLNWPQWRKNYMAVLICLAMMMCNFLAAGPSIAIVQTALDFFPPPPAPDGSGPDPDAVASAIASVAYFFTTTALLHGTGNFFWVPIANKFGRRPVYIASYTLYLATAIWLIFERSYTGFLAGRILMGLGAGAAETIAPVSIADVFFLHERGTIMALYTSFLSVGVAFGIIISGLITIHHDWRVIYEVAAALVGLILLLAFFTFPETAYIRRLNDINAVDPAHGGGHKLATQSVSSEDQALPLPPPKKQSYLQSLKIFNGVLTEESLFKIFIRPLGLICLPPVLWAALVQSVTIGFLVAVSSNVAPAYQQAYGFEPYQVGLCFVAAIVGSILGIPAGGQLSDRIADWFTKRNDGVRDPEMRLPGIVMCLITTPLALVLYGVGIEHQLHWICPTIGLGLLNFSITQGTNICLVYVIDAYRPVAAEVTLAVMGFKSLFGFLLSFYTNPWVQQSGYQNAYGAMAGIAACILILWVPLYFFGKRIRRASWNWKSLEYTHWKDDREVGE